MRALFLGIVVGMLLALGAGCKSDVPYYCDESTPCLPRYSDRPFCDLYGTYDASGHVGRTCIPNPLDGSVGIDAAVNVDSGMPPADGGTDAAPNAPDAGTPDAGNPDAQTGPCDPVTQTGCASGEKCTFIIDTSDPTNNHTGCAPNGTVAAGAACTRDANGVDDCLRPYFCSGGVCTEICSTNPESCPSTATCTPFAGLFDDRTTSASVCRSVIRSRQPVAERVKAAI